MFWFAIYFVSAFLGIFILTPYLKADGYFNKPSNFDNDGGLGPFIIMWLTWPIAIPIMVAIYLLFMAPTKLFNAIVELFKERKAREQNKVVKDTTPMVNETQSTYRSVKFQ